MALRSAFLLVLACMASVTELAAAATSKFVDVQAGDLVDAVESLARQYGIDVVYPSSQLKGLQTRGVNGTFAPTDAFTRLLEGTPLVLKETGGALLITARASRPTIPGKPIDPLDEVEINARHEKLSAMRAEMVKLEDRFYARYNELNSDDQYDMGCAMEAPTGSHVKSRICRPVFVAQAERFAGSAGGGIMWGDIAVYKPFGPPAWLLILQKWPAFEQSMLEAINKDPGLRKLIREREALEERYKAMRKQKFKGRIIVLD